MTAAVTALPGTARLVSVADMTLAERKDRLTWLADAVTAAPPDWPAHIVADFLALYASPALTPGQKADRFESYRVARIAELNTAEGYLTWSELSDDMGPEGHHYTAEEQAEQIAYDAMRALAGRNADGGTA